MQEGQQLAGDMGANLSGGPQQRLTIARALDRQLCLVLMDEPTRHLDLGNERALSDNIKNLHMTRVIVAHRAELSLLLTERLRYSEHWVDDKQWE